MHLLDAERALLVQLRSALDGGSRRINGKRMKADEIAQLAAATALKLGDLKTYCEVQADQGGDGRWAAALAMAPAVGVDFWREMCARARELAAAGAEPLLSAPFLVATGDARGAVHHFLTAGDGADAHALAAAAASGALPPPPASAAAPAAPADGGAAAPLSPPAALKSPPSMSWRPAPTLAPLAPLGSKPPASPAAAAASPLPATAAAGPSGGAAAEGASLVSVVAARRAAEYMESGQSVLAACCYLAHGDGARAVGGLLRAHELELALAVTRALGLDGGDALLAALARRAERLGWDLALRSSRRCATRARSSRSSPPATRATSRRAPRPTHCTSPPRPPSAASYRQEAEAARKAPPADVVRGFIAGGDAAAAVAYALPIIHKALAADDGTGVAAAAPLLALLRAADVDDASGVEPPQRKALLACSAFEACLQATWRGYTPIVLPLLRAAVTLTAAVARDPWESVSALALPPAALDALSLQVAAYRCRLGCGTARGGARRARDGGHAVGVARGGARRAGGGAVHRAPPAHSSREVCATGAALPSSSKQRGRVSSVSGEKVLGAPSSSATRRCSRGRSCSRCPRR